MIPINSLRRRLLINLVAWVVPFMLITGLISYGMVHRMVGNFYDRNLYRTALALADQVTQRGDEIRADLPKIAQELIEFDTDDDIHFQILFRGQDLTQRDSLPLPSAIPGEDKHVFYDIPLKEGTLRAVAYHLPVTLMDGLEQPVLVLVSETQQKRVLAVEEVVIAVLLFELVTALGFFSILTLALKRGLHPLDMLSKTLGYRADDDLSPLDAEHAPLEVRPLVQAFNDKLSRLEESIRREKRFIEDAAHQLKTPLAGVKMQAEIALRANELEKTRHALQQLKHASENMAHTVSQLLTLARAEPGAKVSWPMKPVSLNSVVANILPHWEAKAKEKSIVLRRDLHEDIVVMANEGMLSEMLTNLLDNAIRYTPPGGQVQVNVLRNAIGPCVQVKDNGAGLAAEELNRVFERFYRVLDQQEEGSGLGLTIAREIAQIHEADLSLSSAGLGQGLLVAVQFRN